MNIGERIKASRKMNGLTQKQLAEKLGVATITIQQYEGRKRIPSIEQLNKIADIVGVDIASFFDRETIEEIEGDIDVMKTVDYLSNLSPEKYRIGMLKAKLKFQKYELLEQARNKCNEEFLLATDIITESELKRYLLEAFECLNKLGKLEAVRRVTELSELPLSGYNKT